MYEGDHYMKLQTGLYWKFLREKSWKFIENYLNPKKLGRPRLWTIREVINAILYICKTGCQWRNLPPIFPPWQTVYTYFARWRDDGTWDYINRRILEALRHRLGRDIEPSLIIIDSQSARTTALAESKGFDGNKKVKGRKRTIIVDVLGYIVAVSVANANIHDTKLAVDALEKVRKPFRLHICFADQGYRGQLGSWSFRILGIALKVVPRSKNPNKIVTERRWVVERTFAWLFNYRRLSIDYERKARSEEAWIKIAMMSVGIRRLERV